MPTRGERTNLWWSRKRDGSGRRLSCDAEKKIKHCWFDVVARLVYLSSPNSLIDAVGTKLGHCLAKTWEHFNYILGIFSVILKSIDRTTHLVILNKNEIML
jgi:hypothetical protein